MSSSTTPSKKVSDAFEQCIAQDISILKNCRDMPLSRRDLAFAAANHSAVLRISNALFALALVTDYTRKDCINLLEGISNRELLHDDQYRIESFFDNFCFAQMKGQNLKPTDGLGYEYSDEFRVKLCEALNSSD